MGIRHRDIPVRASSDCTYKTCHDDILFVCIANYMIKKCHYDVILWGGFGSTKCDPNLTSHLRRFFAGHIQQMFIILLVFTYRPNMPFSTFLHILFKLSLYVMMNIFNWHVDP